MTEVHALGGLLIMILAAGCGLLGTVIWTTGRGPRWADAVWLGLLAILVVQGAIGILRAWSGAGPSEVIHWVYGVASLIAVAAAGILATDAPARRQGAVIAGAAAVLLLLGIRLAGTG